MKTKIMIIMGCLTFFFSTASFSWSQWDGCQNETGFSDNYCNTCQCTDLNYGKNDCMSLSDYCEAFGNPGVR